jgi:hypothetical protein
MVANKDANLFCQICNEPLLLNGEQAITDVDLPDGRYVLVHTSCLGEQQHDPDSNGNTADNQDPGPEVPDPTLV